MSTSGYLSSSRDDLQDVGTLWTMRRHEHSARCALLAGPSGWELRVLIDLALLLRERCTRTDDAFSTAERWKRRMLHDGWRQVVPTGRK